MMRNGLRLGNPKNESRSGPSYRCSACYTQPSAALTVCASHTMRYGARPCSHSKLPGITISTSAAAPQLCQPSHSPPAPMAYPRRHQVHPAIPLCQSNVCLQVHLEPPSESPLADELCRGSSVGGNNTPPHAIKALFSGPIGRSPGRY